jgi:SulP family sulfate permease
MIVAVVLAAAAATAFQLPVETIGTRFGAIPRLLLPPSLPDVSLAKAIAVLPEAFAFAVLGAIESLLSAVVADGMTGRRHRSNCELVAQGAANIGAALFGGICATGTVARTVTNVRAGAHGPVAGMLHAVFLLALLVLAAPLAVHVPLAALAGVLAVVAWGMAERHQFATLLRSSRGDAVVLLATFGLTVFRDLIEAIVVGFTIGTLLFLNRMAEALSVERLTRFVSEDRADAANGQRAPYDQALATDPDVAVYRVSGAFFFGSVSTMTATLDRIGTTHRAFVMDMSAVPFIDSSGANAINGIAQRTERSGIRLYVAGASPAVRRVLLANDVRPPRVRFARTIDSALAHARQRMAKTTGTPADTAVRAAG